MPRRAAKAAPTTRSELLRIKRWGEQAIRAIQAGTADKDQQKQLASLLREQRTITEKLGAMSGEVQGRTVSALLHRLGVKTEEELVTMVEEKRRLSDITLDDLVRDCVEGLVFAFKTRPELIASVKVELFGAPKPQRASAGSPQMEE